MKPTSLMIVGCLLMIAACNKKSIPGNSKKEIPKVEMMAYYQASNKLGYLVESVKINGNNIVFKIVHNGGCKPHTFRLICDSSIAKSNPVQTNLYLVHDNNGDTCADEIKKELIFDITRLKNLGYNPIQLNIDHLNTVLYEIK
jgi:hypothetical protein